MHNKKQLGFIIILLLSVLACTMLFFTRILPADVFHWDEGHHAVYGTWIYNDITSGDWDSFWQHTHHQAYWPFLHSWFLAIFFIFFGKTYASARFLSLCFLFLTVIFTYLVSLRTDKEHGWIVGILAVFLLFLSPLLVSLSVQSMIELIGVFLFIMATFLYFKCIEAQDDKKKLIFYFSLGLILAISLITKYNYAMHLIPSIGIILFIDLIKEMRGGRWETRGLIKYGLVLLPIILISLWWFLGDQSSRKIQFVFWTQKTHAELGFGQTVYQYFYYLWIVISEFTFSKWLGALVLASIGYSFFLYKKNNSIRALSLMFLSSFLISTFALSHRLDRLFIFVIPWSLIIFSFCCVFLIKKILKEQGQRKTISSALAIILFLPVLFGVREIPKILFGETQQEHNIRSILDFYKSNIPEKSSISSILSFPKMSPYTISFHFFGWQGPVYTAFNVQAPGFFKSEYFLSLEPIEDGSPVFDGGAQPKELIDWNKALKDAVEKNFIIIHKEEKFDDLKIKAVIYRKNK